MSLNGYFLHGANEEKLMVIRGYDEETMKKIIDILHKSRDEDIRKLAEVLESHLNERYDNGGSPIKIRSKNQKDGRKRR